MKSQTHDREQPGAYAADDGPGVGIAGVCKLEEWERRRALDRLRLSEKFGALRRGLQDSGRHCSPEESLPT